MFNNNNFLELDKKLKTGSGDMFSKYLKLTKKMKNKKHSIDFIKKNKSVLITNKKSFNKDKSLHKIKKNDSLDIKKIQLKKIFNKPKLSLNKKLKNPNNKKKLELKNTHYKPFYKKKNISKNKWNVTLNNNKRKNSIIINNNLKIKNIINIHDNFIKKSLKKSYINNNKFLYEVHSQKGKNPYIKKKCNQDKYFIKLNLCKNQNIHLFGVCDGHGEFGELVSGFIENNLPGIIESYLISNDAKTEKNEIILYNSIEKLIQKLSKSKINLMFSGSTLNLIWIYYKTCYILNVGDSRSAICFKNNNKYTTKNLSFDHKPNLKLEKERIIKAGGRVDKLVDNFNIKVGPYRVWLKNEEYPGLAMSRSIGDLVAASVGVSWKPEISIYDLNDKDKIIFLASDGVWEVMNSNSVMNELIPYHDHKQIKDSLINFDKILMKKWSKESSIDDITYIIIFINY